MSHSVLLWGLFIVFIIAMLLIDLWVFSKDPHKITIKESLSWTGIWISLAVTFGVGVYYFLGHQKAIDYYTGYLIEYSLSVDNIFVFFLVFNYFGVEKKYQHEVLFWGIFGALVFRMSFIFAGVALLNAFHWIIYIFGAFLVYTGIKLALNKDKKVDPDNNPVISFVHKIIPVSESFHKDHFFIKKEGKRLATPLLIVLIVIETTDIVFALDSIPAILSITRDQFIVFSSNAFAILGLRALYFALSAVMQIFEYLHYGLAVILVFVGAKMLTSEFYDLPTAYALGFIGLTLIVSVIASMLFPPDDQTKSRDELPNA